MADLFVSYSSEDRDYVRLVVEELESQGWTVWWDRDIEVGSSFDKTIERAIDGSHCIVVVWSRSSIESDWVRAEAAEGLQRNLLVPVLLDDVRPPLLFRQKQAVSLVDWKRTDGKSRSALSALFPVIRTKLEHERNLGVPVSTQKAWLIDTVCDATRNDPTIAPALYGAMKLAFGFLEGVFVYPGDMSGKSEELVKDEGLDGLVRLSVQPEGGEFLLALHLDMPRVDSEETFRESQVERDELIICVGRLLSRAASALQGAGRLCSHVPVSRSA